MHYFPKPFVLDFLLIHFLSCPSSPILPLPPSLPNPPSTTHSPPPVFFFPSHPSVSLNFCFIFSFCHTIILLASHIFSFRYWVGFGLICTCLAFSLSQFSHTVSHATPFLTSSIQHNTSSVLLASSPMSFIHLSLPSLSIHILQSPYSTYTYTSFTLLHLPTLPILTHDEC